MPIQLLTHAATELCDIAGVDADVAFCKGQHRLDLLPSLALTARS